MSVHDISERLSRIKQGSGGGSGSEPPMNDLTRRVEHLEREVGDVRVILARMETKLDNCVTKAQLSTYALLALIGVLGGGWWVVQQYLSPILQAAGAS